MRQRLVRLLRVSILLLMMLPVAASQESTKTLEWGEHAKLNCRKSAVPDLKTTYQIELEDILIDGRPVLIGEPFIGDIRNLVFVVKNVSDQPLEFIQFTVMLPDGKRPVGVPFVRSPESKGQPLRPGEQTELRVPAGKIYDWVNEAVISQGMTLSAIKRGVIDYLTVGGIAQGVKVCASARDPRNECPSR